MKSEGHIQTVNGKHDVVTSQTPKKMTPERHVCKMLGKTPNRAPKVIGTRIPKPLRVPLLKPEGPTQTKLVAPTKKNPMIDVCKTPSRAPKQIGTPIPKAPLRVPLPKPERHTQTFNGKPKIQENRKDLRCLEEITSWMTLWTSGRPHYYQEIKVPPDRQPPLCYPSSRLVHHIIKIVSYGVARPVGQVEQWAMAHLKGLGPHMNTLCALF